METIILNTTTRLTRPCVATIGFFDGVHRGHQYLIGRVVEQAKKQGLTSMVVTFDRDPMQVVAPEREPMHLSSTALKLEWLASTGVDYCVVLPFDRQTAQQTASDFMQSVLKGQLCVDTLMLGYDNRFGKRQGETFEDYAEYGRRLGMKVLACDAFSGCGIPCSSSLIRQEVAAGNMETTMQLLGRPYTVEGKVVDGEKTGRRLGYPTANILPTAPRWLLPPEGVYAVRIEGAQLPGTCTGMMNIGRRPTFSGTKQTLEVHIFHFDGNLYGDSLRIKFYRQLRKEHAFESEQQLVEQLHADQQQTEQFFKQTENA